jgi:hypothetical protein
MTNRDKINRTCIYDLMMQLGENVHICPVLIFGRVIPEKYNVGCRIPQHCDTCVRDWLNKEAKP